MPISLGFWEWGCPKSGDVNQKETGLDSAFAKTSGIVTGDAPVSYWLNFFPLSLVTSPRSL